MTAKYKIDYRIGLAEYDLETAQVLLDSKRYLYVGFMCHQVGGEDVESGDDPSGFTDHILKHGIVLYDRDNPEEILLDMQTCKAYRNLAGLF